jgi:hypothetical protein
MLNSAPHSSLRSRLAAAAFSHLVLLVLALSSAPVHAQDDFSSPEVLGRWMTYYYVNPQPHRVADAIQAASSRGFMRNGQNAPPFIGFLAGVISKTPATAQSLAGQLASLPEADQPVLILGIWYSSLGEAKPLLEQLARSMPKHREMIDHLLAHGRPGLLEIPLEQGPWVLDALWGNFMATGDDAPVVRIISALPWINVRGDVPRLLVGGAARWSLISNAVQHERAMAVSREQLALQPKEVREVLLQVIAEAEKDLRQGRTR